MKLFGPTMKDVLQAFSTEIQGQYKETGLFKEPRVDMTYRNWRLHLDVYTQSTGQTTIQYTRVRAAYVNTGAFKLTVYRQGMLSAIGKALGLQDIETGFEEFDAGHVIKGSDPEQVVRLFQHSGIRASCAGLPDVMIEIRPGEGFGGVKLQPSESLLTVRQLGAIRDAATLKALTDCCALMLEALVSAGLASDGAPEGRLYKDEKHA